MMDKKRLLELKKYVQCIRTNGWISLMKSDDLLTLIDAALSHDATTDAEVQRAIELIEERRALVYGALDKNIPDDDRVYLWRNIKSFDLAIRALQQYRTGPCEWCVPEAEFFVASALDSKHVRDTDEPNFCPNCGRQLDLIPSESTQSGAIRQARGDDEK